jgi:formate dehydrogenase gamma subunit
MERTGLKKGDAIRRFGTARVAEHWLLIAAVALLALTGLAQRFYYLDISRWFILALGGIDNARLIHRYTGVVFSAGALLHVAAAVAGVALWRWEPSMLINKNDFIDAVRNIKYYIGMEERQAACGRYNYKQKFEYWGILTGGLLMTATGLALWFPTLVARYLPGEAIPVAKALHTNEALLIFLLIAVWHVYNAIFSPDVFPLDTSIFTGYISRERMEREHPLELARMEGADGLDGREASGGRENAKP